MVQEDITLLNNTTQNVNMTIKKMYNRWEIDISKYKRVSFQTTVVDTTSSLLLQGQLTTVATHSKSSRTNLPKANIDYATTSRVVKSSEADILKWPIIGKTSHMLILTM